jgi:hypothetical protein
MQEVEADHLYDHPMQVEGGQQAHERVVMVQQVVARERVVTLQRLVARERMVMVLQMQMVHLHLRVQLA